MTEKFGQGAIDALRHYVYGLADPRISDPIQKLFYIGKGKDNRAFDHLACINAPSNMSLKLDMIKAIQTAGLQPEILIIQHGLNEKEAHRLEAQLICVVDGLTNLVGGHHAQDYWLSALEVSERHDEPIEVKDSWLPALFVSLNGSRPNNLPPYPEIAEDPEELKRRTIGDWTIGANRAREVKLIVGCYKTVARCAYNVKSESMVVLEANGRATRCRWGSGDQAITIEKQVKGRTIVDRAGTLVTKFERRPWRYV